MVEIPWGITGSQFFYDVDADFIRQFYAASKREKVLINGRSGYSGIFHEEYLEKLGVNRLNKLKANSVVGYSTTEKGDRMTAQKYAKDYKGIDLLAVAAAGGK